ncbi:alginate O-acetyltransferase AlgX-related protein [Pedosphaera parvula]|uniref:Alginate O-acetyltransferase AlgJ n=1 Tax=Pedosphaera parvula (strain Ellin514) TaxID=320771 RepID=B9XM55_PEDPL|nr:alginate O-acetyltransferase [Pedosphaera parvula]EEF59048.1 alginate O-acetyltransferase AlgJ [Pedosphaera parvula Ellin514]
MNDQPSQPREPNSPAQMALIIAFVLFLWLPTLSIFFHWDHSRKLNEKRKLAEFPAWHAGSNRISNFIIGLDKYYSDHFGFRKQLILFEHAWKRQIYKESPFPDVLIGKYDWLYYSGDHMIENCQGSDLFCLQELHDWQSLLECRRDWLARQGIHYIFVIPPDKHRIYPEYLPEWIAHLGPTSKLDQFFGYMKTNSSVEVLDLRPALMEAKHSRFTYLRNDTHWNEYGAFVGYQALLQKLSCQMPHLKPLSPDCFQLQYSDKPGGDLATMLGQEQTLHEKEAVSLSPRPPLQLLQISNAPNLLGKYWNPERLPVITTNPSARGNAIVFRDSFSIAWIPYIGHNFNKVTYLWQRELDLPFIQAEKPDVVVDEILERFFCRSNPHELKLSEGWR